MGAFVLEHDLGAVMAAPIDILLPGVASPVQPEVVFLEKENLPDLETAQNFEGVPGLVVEVLSPKTRQVDEKVKYRAYEEAGVPEYWMVDPEKRDVVVYRLEGHKYKRSGRFGVAERLHSVVLEGVELRVSWLFP